MTAGKTTESVAAFMVKRSKFTTVKIDDTIETAFDRFATEKVKRLVVVDAKGEPKGLLTSGILLRWLAKRIKELRSRGLQP